jgi:uncharacterized protein (DUF1697 family)
VTRYIAFLRAINVGGHTVKMDALREIFAGLGLANVETFIASGNVIFESPEDAATLEKQIEANLREELGYAVATFLRTDAEVARIAAYVPFAQEVMESVQALNIAFMASPLDEDSTQKLMALRTEIDDFHTHEREVYWVCKKRQSESTFSNAVFEKALKRQATFRGANTIQRMAAKYPPVG